MEYGMKIVYFDTLYNRESSFNVFGDIEFKDGSVHFASAGRRYAIPTEQIVRIENI